MSQTGLRLGARDDPLEQEADRIADSMVGAAMRSAISQGPARIQRSAGPSSKRPEAAPASVDAALATPGSALDCGLRQGMERQFGHDFSQVRIHTGTAAERSAQDVNARAYTVGHEIVFGAGRFAPETRTGRRLLGHELTHVMQQQGGQSSVQRAPKEPALTVGEVDIKSADPNCQYQEGEVERSHSAKGILENDIDRGKSFGVTPSNAVVIADFRVDDGNLRPETESIFRKVWLPKLDKNTMATWEIVGFNDCVGFESRNAALRAQRALAVGRLVPWLPASPADLFMYLVDNTSGRNRAINRSVIIRPKEEPPLPPPKLTQADLPIEPQEAETFVCSADQRRQLSFAWPVAKLWAQRALAAVSGTHQAPDVQNLLERYFGADALSNLPSIRDGFANILDNWEDWDPGFVCEVQTAERCASDDPNYVIGGYTVKRGGLVHICEAAFSRDDPQLLTLVVLHELSHRLDNTNDHEYCGYVNDCSSLSAKEAIDNADSYAWFARLNFYISK